MNRCTVRRGNKERDEMLETKKTIRKLEQRKRFYNGTKKSVGEGKILQRKGKKIYNVEVRKGNLLYRKGNKIFEA